jgi:hypothetical protein
MSDSQAQFSNPSEHVGNVDLTSAKNGKGQDAHDRLLELLGQVKDSAGRSMHKAMAEKIQSDSYKRGTDGSSCYSAGSRVNMIRDIHHRFQDIPMRQIKKEFPGLADALRADKQNRIAVKHGREVKNPLESILSLNE